MSQCAADRDVDLILAHGASGTAASMMPWVVALQKLGITAVAIDIPRGSAGRAVPRYAAAVAELGTVAIGGHSFGGRVATMVAVDAPPPALVLLSYPLHRPGHPHEPRTAHWKSITTPMLFLSGDRDPFARIDLLRSAVATQPNAELAEFEGMGHGLIPVADAAAERIAAFLRRRH